jgi:hypothetical protein
MRVCDMSFREGQHRIVTFFEHFLEYDSTIRYPIKYLVFSKLLAIGG